MENTRAVSCVSPHLQCLRWCGFCSLAPGSRKSHRTAHAAYRVFILSCTSIYLLQQCIYAYQVHSNMDQLARVMFLLLCHVTSIVKQIVFNFDADRINQLLASFEDPLFNLKHGNALVTQCANTSRRIQRVYSSTALLTCTLWLVFPIANQARGFPVDFPFWLPIISSNTPSFTIILLYSYFVTTLVGVAQTTTDAFIGTLLFQCGTQLKLVRLNLGILRKRAKEISKTSQENFESVLMELFLDCLAHYGKVIEIARQLQSIFGTAILVQFGIGGWILCMAAYKCVSLSMMSVEFASMMLFILCILTELFLYCYFGNELTVESAHLTEALYGTWDVGSGAIYGRALMITTERARRPLVVTAGRMVPLSLETFLKILKSSYSFYAVLRQTK